MYMQRYAFMGPNEHSFDKKNTNKIKKLVKYLFDYEFSKKVAAGSMLEISIKPNTGFTTAVAEAILDYQTEHPDRGIKIVLFTEYKTDFEELPTKTQQLFDKLVGYDGASVRRVICMGLKEAPKGVYSMMTSRGIPVYYYDPKAKKDSTFMKELSYIEIESHRINLFDNLNGQSYQSVGVRKKSNGITYSYRINVNLPNGKKLSEELSCFVTATHASSHREKRLIEAMWQDIEPCELCLLDVVKEYLETKKEHPALYLKYKQYYASFLRMKRVSATLMSDYASTERLRNSLILGLRINDEYDGRRKDPSYLRDEDRLTPKYIQGYYAFLDNVFDYAYQKKYINYQPLRIVRLGGK